MERVLKKWKTRAFLILLVCVFVLTVFSALWFMGVISFDSSQNKLSDETLNDNYTSGIHNDTQNNGLQNESQGAENRNENTWDIVFKGMKLSVKQKGTVIVHESGCLNIRQCDEYLIQIDVDDETTDYFWDNRDEKVKNITAAGHNMELEPEKIVVDEREYIRYIVSLENERGSDYETSYFYLLMTPADDGRRFFVSVRYDGVDMAGLGEAEREKLYDEAMDIINPIMCSAKQTDEPDDETGSYWKEEMPLQSENKEDSYILEDTLEGEDFTVSYNLPETYYLISDNIAGKTYYSDEEDVYINLSVINYSWLTAEDMAESHKSAGISSIISEGETEINDVTFHYYTYSVLQVSGEEKIYNYNFHAYGDMKNGDIFAIYGYTYSNPEVLNEEYFHDVMNIKEE